MTAPAFHEEWFCTEAQEALANLGRHVDTLSGLIVEIGAWEGRSTVALANAVYPRIVHTCDTWQGEGAEATTTAAAERDVYAQWQANVKALTKGNVVGYRMGWREFVPQITDRIALAFIDAEHSYREVYDNVAAMIPLMQPGGIMCGDDAHYGPVQDAVYDLFGVDGVLWSGTSWVFQIPTDQAALDALRLRAMSPALSPTEHEYLCDLDTVFTIWRRYVNGVSTPDMAASHGTLAYLWRLCDHLQPRRILDLGSGLSSAVFRRWGAQNGVDVEVVSVDTDPEWLTQTRNFLISEELPTDGLYLLPDGIHGEFDLVFHDIAGGDLRNEIATTAVEHLAPGGFIVFDDAQFDPHLLTYEKVARDNGLELFSLAQFTTDAIGRWSVLGIRNGRPAAKAISDLAEKYARVAATESDIWLHLPRFVELVLRNNVTKVIELGTRTGVSTIAWLFALEQTGGHLWSVDIDAKPPIGDYPHWTFIQGDDEAGSVLRQLPEQVDIVFLDTSHHYEHTLRELRAYRSRVRPGGVIVCHDTELPIPEGAPRTDPVYPVKTAIKQFCQETGLKWHNYPDCWGLGIIEVV